jgi:hypothetical protein
MQYEVKTFIPFNVSLIQNLEVSASLSDDPKALAREVSMKGNAQYN